MAEEQQTHTDNDITTALLPQTGEQAYALIKATYHLPLTWDTFVRALVDKHGRSNRDACLLLAWCLSWYNVPDGKRPVFRGEVPYLDSAGLAADWGMSRDRMKRVRRALSKSGLVKFESERHNCLVYIQWGAVAEAVRREAEFRGCKSAQSNFRGCKSAQPKPFRGCKSAQPKRLEGANLHPTLLHRSPSYLPPSSEEEAETNEARVERMLDYGRKAGRSCDRKWVKDAHEAFDAVVADGHDPALVERAWYAYVDEKGKAATDLGHWLRGLNLRGEETDEGEWAFVACYDHAKSRAEREADRERVAAGGMPTARLIPTDEGWLELGSERILPGVPADATREEAEAAWPAIWEDWQRAQAS